MLLKLLVGGDCRMSNQILIVDDKQIILDVLVTYLKKKQDFKIFTARSAQEALMKWEENNIGIVLTDIHLGGDMDGISLCSRIRHKDLKTVVIAMTGYTNEYNLEYCLSIGFRDFLNKPMVSSDLDEVIKCAISQRKRWLHSNFHLE